MNALKETLVPQPVLNLQNCTGHITSNKDTCDEQFGRILLQKQDNETRSIRYWSRTLEMHKKDTIQRKENA